MSQLNGFLTGLQLIDNKPICILQLVELVDQKCYN